MFNIEIGVFKTEMMFPDIISDKAQHCYHSFTVSFLDC